MKKLVRNTALIIATGSLVGTSLAPGVYAQDVSSQNISGSDRFSTAVKISQSGWNQSETVILTNANAVADSLSVAPLASKLRVPVLLTQSNALNEATRTEISRLGAKKVLIIGGQYSISSGATECRAALPTSITASTVRLAIFEALFTVVFLTELAQFFNFPINLILYVI